MCSSSRFVPLPATHSRVSRKLQVDLTDEERAELASAIAALSRAREHHMQNFDG